MTMTWSNKSLKEEEAQLFGSGRFEGEPSRIMVE